MRHHVPGFTEIVRGKEPGKISTLVHNLLYEKGFLKKQVNAIRNLDPDNTTINIVNDSPLTNPDAANIDFICEQGCPYINQCSYDTMNTVFKMFKKRWYLSPVFIGGGLYNNRKSKSLESNIPEGRYHIRQFLTKLI